jgi:hypothetical protein
MLKQIVISQSSMLAWGLPLIISGVST